VEARLGADLWRRAPGRDVEGVVPGTDKKPYSDLTAAWKILDPQRWLRYSQALAQREQAAYALEDRRRELESSLVSAYYDLLEAQKVLELRSGIEEVEAKAFELESKRVDRGSSAPRDLIGREQALLRARLQRAQSQSSREQAAATLAYLLGRPIESGQELEAVAYSGPREAGDPSGWREKAAAQRGDLASQREAVRASRRSVSQALLRRLPEFSVGFQYALDPDPFYGVGSRPFKTNLLDRDAAWSLGAALSIPLFSGGALRAEHKDALANLRSAEAQLDLAVREVERDVRSALAVFAAALEELAVRERERELRSQSTAYVEKLYHAGMRYQEVDWHRARTDLASTDVDLVQATVRAQEAWVRLRRSAGLPLAEEKL
jgi:outer membrane protein TolC